MAVVKGPLFSLDASGSIAKSIVFSKWRGRNYVRRHAIPSNPRSGLQLGVRAVLKFITQDYTNLSDAIKEAWSDLAAGTNITLLNASIALNVAAARRDEGIIRSPGESAGTTPDAAASFVVTPGIKSNSIAWTADTNDPEYVWYLYRDIGATCDSLPENLIAVLPAATLSYLDIGLITGIQYAYTLVGGNFDGERGADAADDDGTPT
jgi:hypothetical protein